MNVLPCPPVVILLAVLPLTSCQDPVPIQFQNSPVLVATGTNAVFTVQTISNIFSITWLAPGGGTLGQWINNQSVLNPISQYQGRVGISATQLTISSCQLSDAGAYTATVTPSAPTGLSTNSRSVTLSVFVAVGEVSLLVPSVSIEGGNVSLTCSWTSGTNITVTWGKGSTNLPSDSRFIINAGSLIIRPVNRNDAGQYTCTVSNPVSSRTATASLTVYYGPDTPQVSLTSTECVGGGDAVIGQTVQLTCTSVSLPPALLSWQHNGVPLTSSQANGGTLNLQVFSTNQSGQYTCLARNSITTLTTQQQTSLNVVATCLSGGAVAGIVVACFVVLVLIIVAIILLLRQRNVDRRLRTVIAQRKEPLNNRPTVLPAPQNGHDNPGFLSQGDQPDPPLHYNRNNRPKNEQTTEQHNDILMQNRNPNTAAIQSSSILNTGMVPNNANVNSNGHVHHSQWNGNTNQHNSDSFQQMGQQNPNIVIQTGNAEPGPHTVLINLNTLPQHQNATTQPHTVQLSLNAPQPHSRPNQNAMEYNDQQSNAIQQETAITSRSNPRHVSGSHSTPQTRMDNVRNTAQPAHSSTLRNGQHSDHHVTNRTRARRNTRDTHNYSEQTRTQLGSELSVDHSIGNTHPRQMPWDRMHGTPAYPNRQIDSYESQNSTQQSNSLDSESDHSAPGLRPWRPPANEQVRNISRNSRRNFLRQLAHSAAQRRSRADREAPRQVTQPNVIDQPRADHQSRTAPQNITPQNITPRNITPRNITPRNIMPQNITPQNITPQNITPQNITPRNITPQNITPQNVTPRNVTPRNIMPQNITPRNIMPQNITPRNITPQNITPQNTKSQNMNRTAPVPQHQTVPMQPAQPSYLISETGPDQRQSGPLNAAVPNSLMLTQAALEQHTSQTPNPFNNRIQQTQAALQHPGTQSAPAQTLPERQINRAGQVAPDPPPVLRPAEFKMLPRKHLHKPHTLNPVQVPRRPAVVHHGHRPPNMTRHGRPMQTNPHKHARAHGHGTTHGHTVHMNQVHRSRPRP